MLAQRHLHAGSTGYGVLLAAIGLGAATGPQPITRRTDDPCQPILVFGPYLACAAVDTILGTVTTLAPAAAALVGYGLATSTGAVSFAFLLQAEVSASRRGRVFAGFDLTWQAGRLLSLGVGGAVADTLGITTVYYLGAALLTAAAAIGWITLHANPPGAAARVLGP